MQGIELSGGVSPQPDAQGQAADHNRRSLTTKIERLEAELGQERTTTQPQAHQVKAPGTPANVTLHRPHIGY